MKNLGWGVVLTLFYIPGAAFGGWLSDKIGRKQTLCIGFTLQGCVGFILGGTLKQIVTSTPAFIIIYGLFLTLGEVGPGATILTLSSECFPTSIRGQCLGFICAWGKAGAAIGTSVFSTILFSFGDNAMKANQSVFLIGSGVAIIGGIGGWFLLENNGRYLDNEDEEWKAYLSREGYTIQWGDHDTMDPAGVKMDTVRS